MYFECNLDRNISKVYHPSIYQNLVDTVALIHNRTDKLNEALDICMLPGCKTKGETFAVIAKRIFDFDPQNQGSLFDKLLPEELASLADSLYDGCDAEERVEFPNSEVVFDTWFATTHDWESLRHFGSGGSDSSTTLELNPYQSMEGLWFEKLGFPEYIKDSNKESIFARGHFLENTVINTFTKMKGAHRIPEHRMFRSKKYKNSTANIDAIIKMADGTLAIFEAKTAARGKEGEWMGQKIPANYVTQCIQYMGVLDDPRISGAFIGMIPVADVALDGTYIASAYNDDFYWHFIERDRERETEIFEAEKEFWDTYIANGIKPPMSHDPEIDKRVMLQYAPSPLSDSTIAEQKLSYEAWEEKLLKLKEAEKETKEKQKAFEKAQEKRDDLRNQIIAGMNGAQIATYFNSDGKQMFTVKNTLVTKKGVNQKSLQEKRPDIFAEFFKAITYTKFTLQET